MSDEDIYQFNAKGFDETELSKLGEEFLDRLARVQEVAKRVRSKEIC